MNEIRGIVFALIKGKGTRSEGHEYFIKPLDHYQDRWSKILVRKKTHMWENDPVLHNFLDKKVLIRGEIIETKHTITIDYTELKALE